MSENLDKLTYIVEVGFDSIDKHLDTIDGQFIEFRQIKHSIESLDNIVGDMTSVNVLSDIQATNYTSPLVLIK